MKSQEPEAIDFYQVCEKELRSNKNHGISSMMISRMKNGRIKKLDIRTVAKIAEIAGITVDELYKKAAENALHRTKVEG